MSDELDKRRRALEEAFFNRYNEELLTKLRAQDQAVKRKHELSTAFGISDPVVLDDLLAAGVDRETLAAMSLAPLVLLAWRNGRLEDTERAAILRAADEQGMPRNNTARLLLEKWLDERPGDELLTAWTGYIAALRKSLPAPAYETLRKDLLDRTQKLARAAGGFLGFNRVTADEKEMIAKIEAILA